MNRKGFTLVELLITIAIVGIVLSLGTYFVMNVVENAKENAYNTTKKSVLESAVIYAGEYLDETDWVEVSDENNTDRVCISVQWLINKGFVKKEDFNPSGITEDYKFNTDHVVVLKKDSRTKTIRYDDVYKSNEIKIDENGTCNNLFKAEITSVSTTTKSITVNGKCSIKNVIPGDIEYTYCVKDIKDINGKCDTTNTSIHTWSNLDHKSKYDISFSCKSKEFGDANVDDFIVYTDELKAPSISVNSINAQIDFEYSTGITRKYSVDKNGVKNSSGILNAGATNISDSKIVSLYGTSITEDVTITATNSDGKNEVTTSAIIEAPEITTPDKIVVYPPQFRSSDEVGSGNWHNSNFSLSLDSINDIHSVTYYYGTNKNDLSKTYNSPIPIEDDTNSTIYYAKACDLDDLNNCSEITSYEVKLDKTPPELNINVKNRLDTSDISLIQNGYTYTKNDWIKAKLTFDIEVEEYGSGLPENSVLFKYSPAGSSSLGALTGNVDSITLNSKNVGSRNIDSDGNRQYQFRICDVVGNCTTKDYFIKTDITVPKVDVSMNYTGYSGGTNLLTCSGDDCINNNWLNKYVTLFFSSKDTLSNLNKQATFKYNYSYKDSTRDEENIKIIPVSDGEKITLSDSGDWTRNITSPGARYVTLDVCDNVNNCTTKKVRFNIDDDEPVVVLEIDDNNKNNLTFTCESLSGVSKLSTYDSANGSKEGIDRVELTWKNIANTNIKPNITITCKNNAGTNSSYTYINKCVNKNDTNTYTYYYCGYDVRTETIPKNQARYFTKCNDAEWFDCNGKMQLKYDNCRWRGFSSDNQSEIFEYREYSIKEGVYTDVSSTEICSPVFEKCNGNC